MLCNSKTSCTRSAAIRKMSIDAIGDGPKHGCLNSSVMTETQNPWPQDLSSRGSSSRSSSSPEEPSSSASQAHMEDAASLYGLNKKNLMKPPDATVLDDLGARQLAYTVSFVTSSMVASDAFEIGGELVTCIDADSCACTTDTKL